MTKKEETIREKLSVKSQTFKDRQTDNIRCRDNKGKKKMLE